MKSVLDSPSQRQIKIIEVLSESNEWVTMAKLASKLDVAPKTITDDVNIIRERWEDELKLESSFVYGVRINQSSASILLKIYAEIFKQSITLKWMELVFYYPYNDLKFYAHKLHVSQSTLYRLFSKINKALNQYEIKLERTHSIYFFSSENETAFRKFMTAIVIDLAGGDVLNKISKELGDSLKQRISENVLGNELLKNTLGRNIIENTRHFYYLIVFYYISLVRESQGFSANNSYYHAYEFADDCHIYAKYLVKTFPRVKAEHVHKVETDISYHFIGWEDEAEQQRVNKVINNFINKLFKKLNITCKEEQFIAFEMIINAIYLDKKNFKVPYAILFDRFDYFSHKLKKEKVGLYNFLFTEFEDLSKTLQVDFMRCFNLLVYWLVTAMPQVLAFRLPKTILVISDLSGVHAEFLAGLLTKCIAPNQTDEILFDYVTKKELPKIDLSKYQLLVSNCLLEGNQIETIIIDDFPTFKDIAHVNFQTNLFD